MRRLVAGLLLGFGALSGLAAQVTVTQPARLELRTNGRASGSILLKAGEQVELVEVGEGHLVVRYRNLTGQLATAATDYRASPPKSPAVAPPAAPTAPVAAKPPEPTAPAAAPAARAPYVPAGVIERSLAGKLVVWENGAVKPWAPERMAGARFIALYFSASWCGPCRAFTPELVDAYGKIRALYPEFEVVHVNLDRSPAAMADYLRDDKMPWPALAWAATSGAKEINRYAGGGIPCLVLVDRDGKVLSDTYRRGRYVGPSAVVDDTWKILRDYRKTHPRPKG